MQTEFQGSHKLTATIRRFIKNQSGATAIEYGLIAALVSIAIIVSLTTLGSKLKSNFTNVSAQLK